MSARVGGFALHTLGAVSRGRARKSARGSATFAALLTLAVGCGGGSAENGGLGGAAPGETGGDTGPRRPTDCSEVDGLQLFLIDDFELGAATNAFTNNEVCADCADSSGDDLGSCQDECRQSQDPTDFDKPLPAELIPDGRCGGRYALHVTTQAFHQWGGVIGFKFGSAFDASDYDGVAFWGRIAWGTRAVLRASVLDPETDATYVDPESGEALCEEDNTLDVFQEACDPFGGYTTLTGDWQLFRVPFEEMRQRGYGHVSSELDLSELRQVSIEYGLGAWDFWIDDLSLYRQEAP